MHRAKHLTNANKRQMTVNVGTSEFMAPEVIGETKADKLAYNEQADIWV